MTTTTTTMMMMIQVRRRRHHNPNHPLSHWIPFFVQFIGIQPFAKLPRRS